MAKPFKLALVQMAVVGGDREGNLARAEARIAEAAQAGAQVALLPECMDAGWTHPSSLPLAAPVPDGEACMRLSAAARRHNIAVCVGITERDGDRVFNTAVYFDAHGALLGKHRKLNELEIGHDYYAQGDRLNVFETAYGVIGLMICADAFATGQMISRTLCLMGAEVILSPCAWAVPADHDNKTDPYGALWRDSYCPVAKENSVWIIGVSNVGIINAGPWQGRRCIGCSLAVDNNGEVALAGPYGADADTIACLDITPAPRPRRLHEP